MRIAAPLRAALGALMLSAAALTTASAQTTFVPPSDPTGSIYSTNSNDGYSSGRGVVFTPTSNYALSSFGLFQNLTNVALSYSLSLAPNSTGYVGGGTVLRSGTSTVSTSGLQWIDFNISPLTLMAGTYYHLEFLFTGTSAQNFFYNQTGAQPYSQAGFAGIDGTQAGGTDNFVMPAIRLNGTQEVPEPSSLALLVAGGAALAGAARRRKTRGA